MSGDNVLNIYLNDGTGSFTLVDASLSVSADILIQAFDFGDIDGDSDLDVLMTGYDTGTNQTVTQIWTNSLVSNRMMTNTSNLFENEIDSENKKLDFGFDFKVYPNPSTDGNFFIQTPGMTGKATIVISSLTGQSLLHQERSIEGQQININASELSTGIYIVRLTQGNESFSSKLIVK